MSQKGRVLPTLVGSDQLQSPLSDFYHHSSLFNHHSQSVKRAEMLCLMQFDSTLAKVNHLSDYPGENPGRVATWNHNNYRAAMHGCSSAITVDHGAMNIIKIVPQLFVKGWLFVLLQPQTSHHNINHKMQLYQVITNLSLSLFLSFSQYLSCDASYWNLVSKQLTCVLIHVNSSYRILRY